MQQRKQLVLLIGVVIMAGAVTACRPVQPAPAETISLMMDSATASVTVTLSKPDDIATVGVQDNQILIDIRSDGGIGAATVTWASAPDQPLILRLHLAGLEELRLAAGDIEIVASVSSSPPHTVSQSIRLGPGAKLQSLTDEDAAWLDISWSSDAPEETSAETATYPLQNGYFDITLNDLHLAQPGTSLEIHWIDFYR
jgi:hypothetical protein